MYYLTRICCLCLNNSIGISTNIFKAGEDSKTYYEKITTSLPNVAFNKNNDNYTLCMKCCENVNFVYEFNHTCIRNLKTFLGYKEKLSLLTNKRGVPALNVIDIGEKVNNYKTYFDQDKRTNSEIEVMDQSNTIDARAHSVVDVKSEPLGKNDGCSQNFACLESHSDIDLTMEHMQIDKLEVQVEDDDGAMDVLTEEDILEDEFAYSEIKIEENDIKVECFGSGVDDVFNSGGVINDDTSVHSQLAENNSSEYTGYGSVEIQKQTDDTNTTTYELSRSCGAQWSNVINEEPKNKANILNTTSPENPSRVTSDTCSSGVDVPRIHKHSTSEEEGSKQSFSIITHSLRHPSYVCDVCDMTFKISRKLVSHKVVHTNQKPHVCDICKKGFGKSSNLTTHKRIHTGQKPFVCDICKKKFNQAGTLATHKLIHTGQKPHVCNICKKKFRQLSNLTSHKLIHTGQKPYACDICKKEFRHSSNVTRHKLVHTATSEAPCLTRLEHHLL